VVDFTGFPIPYKTATPADVGLTAGAWTIGTTQIQKDASGNLGLNMSPASTVVLDLKEPDAATDLIMGLTAGTGARAQVRSVTQADGTSSAVSIHTTTGGVTSEKFHLTGPGNVGLNVVPSAISNCNPSFQIKGTSTSNGAHAVLVDSATDGWLGLFSGTTEADNPAITWQSTGDLRFATTTTTGLGGFDLKALLTGAGQFALQKVGSGISIKEGSNAKMGVATLVAGTVVVSTTAVTASSRIQLTAQSLGTVAVPSALAVSARTAGTSFTILASAATDTSVVMWHIIEPS
jgi:hypothetical protein